MRIPCQTATLVTVRMRYACDEGIHNAGFLSLIRKTIPDRVFFHSLSHYAPSRRFLKQPECVRVRVGTDHELIMCMRPHGLSRFSFSPSPDAWRRAAKQEFVNGFDSSAFDHHQANSTRGKGTAGHALTCRLPLPSHIAVFKSRGANGPDVGQQWSTWLALSTLNRNR